ncbi:hypothetical protein HOLleu_41823 [Holothuria leucospilota]|uniref:Uncharacterized protein n=1 Tax=Holothuria leucospilota TaxID=206669 RepID=A0A9Q0YDZ6_HOLLE|nr:hypothetical protein HOLleu_41823 [Holothuria leucospilota]
MSGLNTQKKAEKPEKGTGKGCKDDSCGSSEPSLQRHVSNVQDPTKRLTRSSSTLLEHEGISESVRLAIDTFKLTVDETLKNFSDCLKQLEKDLGSAVDFQANRIDDLERKFLTLEKSCSENDIGNLQNRLKSQADQINKLERMSRRNNFRLVGCPCEENEKCGDIVQSILTEKFKMTAVHIERAHRDGRGNNCRSPHILVKCLSYKDKMNILRNARSVLRDESFFILDDLTKADLREKKKWSREVKELYDMGTKLRFTAGHWRDNHGLPYNFQNSQL